MYKYSLKFYELAAPLKKLLDKEKRHVWLIGEHKSPWGTIPETIIYEGPIIDEAHLITVDISRMLNCTWSPAEESSVEIGTKIDAYDIEGGIEWER